MKYIIKMTSKIRGKEYSSFFHDLMTGTPFGDMPTFGPREDAKQFDEKPEAEAIVKRLGSRSLTIEPSIDPGIDKELDAILSKKG